MISITFWNRTQVVIRTSENADVLEGMGAGTDLCDVIKQLLEFGLYPKMAYEFPGLAHSFTINFVSNSGGQLLVAVTDLYTGNEMVSCVESTQDEYELDFYWRAQKAMLEKDGWQEAKCLSVEKVINIHILRR